MNSVKTLLWGRDSEAAFGPMRRAWLAALLAAVSIGASGCSGGGGGTGDGFTGSTTVPQPSGRGTVVVTVKDVLGAPVAGADVRINTYWGNEDKRAVADSSGRAELRDVIASSISATVFGPDSFAQTASRSLAPNSVMVIEVTAQPTADATGGIASAWVPAGGVSEDGRTLEFSLRILQVPNADGEFWAWGTDAVRVLACTPDASNDLPRFRPDCISGADGFDAAYEGVGSGAAVSVKRIASQSGAVPPASTYSAALLLDQSAHIAVDDPGDSRLFAAKYFLTSAGADNHILMAAFASDDAASGQFSLLPQKPVSLFPLENPQYASDGRALLSTVDSLVALEGGVAPLFAAIDRMLDFAAAHRAGQNSAVVVLTDGRDETCGSRAECQTIRDALVEKSKATGIAIVTVGLASGAGYVDHESLGLLAQGAGHGAAFWAQNPKQLATVFASAQSHLTDTKDQLEATFRIQSPAADAFAPGRKVLGTVRLEVCPFECYYSDIPFVVQIP